jgi:hypothetical protein
MIFYVSIRLLLDVHSVLSNPFISLLPLFPVKDGTETQQEPTGKFRFNSCEQIEQLLALYLTAGGPAAVQYPSSQIQRVKYVDRKPKQHIEAKNRGILYCWS